jgi:hypothetical protein
VSRIFYKQIFITALFLLLSGYNLFCMRSYQGLIDFSFDDLVDVIKKPCDLSLEEQFEICCGIVYENEKVFFPSLISLTTDQDIYVDSDLLIKSSKYCLGKFSIKELAFLILLLRYTRFLFKFCAVDEGFNALCTDILNNIDGVDSDDCKFIKMAFVKSLE